MVSWVDDQTAITALLNRYARAVDTSDWKLYRSVFTPDAHIDYSSAGAVVGSAMMDVQHNPSLAAEIDIRAKKSERIFAPQFVPGDPLTNAFARLAGLFTFVL